MSRVPSVSPSNAVLPSLSVVIPAHNEVANLERLVSELAQSCLGTLGIPDTCLELILVDDGSNDGTREVIQTLCSHSYVRAIHHESNRGYGAALRSGFAAAKGEFVAFIDGDRQLVAEDICKLAQYVSKERLVLGYRAKRVDPFFRVVLGKLFSRIFVPLTIGVFVKDVDCALKILPRGFLTMAKLTADGALINAEMLAIAQKLGYEFVQVPVRHRKRVYGEQSGAKFLVIARVFFELRRIKRNIDSSGYQRVILRRLQKVA